jgi:hypothetical protein
MSPAVLYGRASSDELAHTPKLTTDEHGALFLQLGGDGPNKVAVVVEGEIAAMIEDRIYNAPERIYEVVRLSHHGLVALSTRDEVFVMTEEEYSAQV